MDALVASSYVPAVVVLRAMLPLRIQLAYPKTICNRVLRGQAKWVTH